jgi:DNA-binding PadR family transcriptional regulator
MSSTDLTASILRILKDEELSGYSVYKLLSMKGEETWPNHVYTLLIQMEKDGLLKSRWEDGKRDARRRHLYSLSESGREEYEEIVKHSLGVLMERFFKDNLSFEDLAFHIRLAKETLGTPGKWSDRDPFRLVIASPAYDPLVCFPKFYYALSEAYPKSTIYVVKSPWEESIEGRKNLTFLDGSRNEMPLRDGFADYVLLQGFPKSASVEDTVNECARVLKADGCLFVSVPKLLTVDRKELHDTTFPEYVLKMFYKLCGQDRSASVGEVNEALSARWEHVRNVEVRGKLIFYAAKKAEATSKRFVSISA